MSVWNIDHNVIFIHNPKTAGSSMERSQHFLGGVGHMAAKDFKTFINNQVTGIEWGKIFKFAFVRNPWDRFVSCFFHEPNLIRGRPKGEDVLVKNERTFRQYVRTAGQVGLNPGVMYPEPGRHILHHHFCPQWFFLSDRTGNGPVLDFIGRFERLHEDWAEVCRIIGEEPAPLPHRHPSMHEHYTEYYDDETIDIIASLYRKDIDWFGYDFR